MDNTHPTHPLLVPRKACYYPEPFQGIGEVVRWFYSRNNGSEVFFACSKDVSDKIEKQGWTISDEFIHYVEMELMPFAVQYTDWDRCYRYGIDYNKKVKKKDRANCPDTGCEGAVCVCEPFGPGDFTYGIADEKETQDYHTYLQSQSNKQ